MRTPADILTDAFFDDELFAWVVPDLARRRPGLHWLFRKLVRATELAGRVEQVEDAGVALWLDPPSTLGPSLVARSGLWRLPWAVDWRTTWRWYRSVRLENAAPEIAHDPDAYYLLCLAVAPDRQGEGISRRLLEPTFARADAEGRACRLETYHEENLAIYARFGFEVLGECFAPGVPSVWMLRREPR